MEEEQTADQQQPAPDWQALRELLSTAFAADFVTAVKPVVEQIGEAIPKIVEVVHTAYIEDGAIYGDTQEGLLRWMHERGKIARLRAQADQLEQYHEGLRHFRRAIVEKQEEEEQA